MATMAIYIQMIMGGPTVLVDSFGNNKNVVGDASDSKIFLWNNGKYMEVPR